MSVNFKGTGYGSLINELFRRIEASRVGDEQQEAKFSAFEFMDYIGLLLGVLDFSEPIPQTEARRIVRSAVMTTAQKGPITKSNFLAEANRLESEYYSRAEQRFVLATSVSIIRAADIPRFRVDNNVIIFESKLPARFKSESVDLVKRARRSVCGDLPDNYLSVRVHVSAKGVHEAVQKAMDCLDLIRGIWNFGINYGRTSRSFGGGNRPLNKIVLGPIHTLHYLDGKLAGNEQWWYQPEYNGAIRLYHNLDQIDELCGLVRELRKKLRKHTYGEPLTEGLLRYTRALDEPRWHIAFRKLWSVLELLTFGTGGERARGSAIDRRAVYRLKDRDYHLYVLRQLREHRNELVHADTENIEVQTYLNQLKIYVEALFDFHIENKYKFTSMKQALSFLKQPHEREALKERMELAKSALDMFGID